VGEIRKLAERDFADVVQVFANAYPGMKLVTDEDMRRARCRLLELHDEPTAEFYGYTRESQPAAWDRWPSILRTKRSTLARI
jgi:hypothetical protein